MNKVQQTRKLMEDFKRYASNHPRHPERITQDIKDIGEKYKMLSNKLKLSDSLLRSLGNVVQQSYTMNPPWYISHSGIRKMREWAELAWDELTSIPQDNYNPIFDETKEILDRIFLITAKDMANIYNMQN